MAQQVGSFAVFDGNSTQFKQLLSHICMFV